MENGFFNWYRVARRQEETFDFLEVFASHGFTPVHPATGLVTVHIPRRSAVGSDELVVAPGDLAGVPLPESPRGLWFRLRLDGDTEVPVDVWRENDEWTGVWIDLDDLSPCWKERFVDAALETVDADGRRCVGFVCDPDGISWDTDWRGVLTQGPTFVNAWPEAMGLRPEAARPYLEALPYWVTVTGAHPCLLVFRSEDE